MRPTVVNIKLSPRPKYDLYIGRANKWLELEGSKWGNPFHLKREADRESVLLCYEAYVRINRRLWRSLPELSGRTLGCYCKPKRCHGDVLAELFDDYMRRTPLPVRLYHILLNKTLYRWTTVHPIIK